MPHQDKSQKCYLDQGINLEWPNLIATKLADHMHKHKIVTNMCQLSFHVTITMLCLKLKRS